MTSLPNSLYLHSAMCKAMMRPRPAVGGRSPPPPETPSRRKTSRSRPSHPPAAENYAVRRNPSGRNACKTNPTNLVMEDVRILKRGETLRPLPHFPFSAYVINNLAPCSTDRLGPDPKSLPIPSSEEFPQPISAYAGSAFNSSPPPSSLPVPAFLKIAVATVGLRYILQIDGV